MPHMPESDPRFARAAEDSPGVSTAMIALMATAGYVRASLIHARLALLAIWFLGCCAVIVMGFVSTFTQWAVVIGVCSAVCSVLAIHVMTTSGRLSGVGVTVRGTRVPPRVWSLRMVIASEVAGVVYALGVLSALIVRGIVHHALRWNVIGVAVLGAIVGTSLVSVGVALWAWLQARDGKRSGGRECAAGVPRAVVSEESFPATADLWAGLTVAQAWGCLDVMCARPTNEALYSELADMRDVDVSTPLSAMDQAHRYDLLELWRSVSVECDQPSPQAQ